MTEYKNYIGLDLSLTATGIDAITPLGKLLFSESLLSKKRRGLPRLEWISNGIIEILDPFTDFLCIIEGFSFGSKGQAVFDLGMLGGIVRMDLYRLGIPFATVPPNSLKKFVTGNGNAGKPKMLEMTFRNFGVGSEVLKDDNQVDGYGLAQFGRYKLSDKPLELTQKRQEGLDGTDFEIILR